MIKRLIAIGFIFACTSIAWFVLAGVTWTRTASFDSNLRQQVERVWGAPQVQEPPAVTWAERVTRKVENVEDGKKVQRLVEEAVPRLIPLQSSEIEAALRLDYRQKGLMWYSTYGVDFSAAYGVTNTSGAAREVEVALTFPSRNAVFDDLQFEVAGKPWLAFRCPPRTASSAAFDSMPASV